MGVELPADAEAAQPGGGASEGGEDEVVRAEHVVRQHAAEEREHERGSGGVGDRGEERGVEVEVLARRIVEHAVGVGEEARARP